MPVENPKIFLHRGFVAWRADEFARSFTAIDFAHPEGPVFFHWTVSHVSHRRDAPGIAAMTITPMCLWHSRIN
ncbi:MAG TPA: hypothetical protein VK839_03590 [Erythrobacter sp.]|nr:hypothetical protein [Erythrobacter sp.]